MLAESFTDNAVRRFVTRPDDANLLLAMHRAPSFAPLAQHVDHLLGQEEEDQGRQGHEPSPDEHGVVFVCLAVVTVVVVAVTACEKKNNLSYSNLANLN